MMGEMGGEPWQLFVVTFEHGACLHNHVSQLGIQLISVKIHFHESCQSIESFKRMHCPLSHCVSVLSSHATRCSKGI